MMKDDQHTKSSVPSVAKCLVGTRFLLGFSLLGKRIWTGGTDTGTRGTAENARLEDGNTSRRKPPIKWGE